MFPEKSICTQWLVHVYPQRCDLRSVWFYAGLPHHFMLCTRNFQVDDFEMLYFYPSNRGDLSSGQDLNRLSKLSTASWISPVLSGRAANLIPIQRKHRFDVSFITLPCSAWRVLWCLPQDGISLHHGQLEPKAKPRRQQESHKPQKTHKY